MNSWMKNVLGIYDTNAQTKLFSTIAWFRKTGQFLDGDIYEFGVFKGRGTLAWALLCRELGIKKKIVGFDSFSGFPPVYHQKDDLENFKLQRDTGEITSKHFEDTQLLREIRQCLKDVEITVKNISSSEDFADQNLDLLKRKIDFLKLDNIELRVGDFQKTMQENSPSKACLAIFDCDLYNSYETALDFIWPQLVAGGVCYLDEYYSLKFPGARTAVNEFIDRMSGTSLIKIKIEDDGFERWHLIKSVT